MEVTAQPWYVVLFCLLLVLFYFLIEVYINNDPDYPTSSNENKARDQAIASVIFFIIVLISIGVSPFYGGFIACNMMFLLIGLIIFDIPIKSGRLKTKEKHIEVTRHSMLFSSILFSLSFSFMTLPLDIGGATLGFLVGAIVFFVFGIFAACDESNYQVHYHENPIIIFFFISLLALSNCFIAVFALGKNSPTNYPIVLLVIYILFALGSGFYLLAHSEYNHEVTSVCTYTMGMIILFFLTLLIDNSNLFIFYTISSISLTITSFIIISSLLINQQSQIKLKRFKEKQKEYISDYQPKEEVPKTIEEIRTLRSLILTNQLKLNKFEPETRTESILKDISRIRDKIKEDNWSEVLKDVKLLKKQFKKARNKLGIKICKAYLYFLDGLELIGAKLTDKAIKMFKKSRKSFPDYGFEIEKFNVYGYIGLEYGEMGDKKQAYKNNYLAWHHYLKCDPHEFEMWGNLKLKNYILNKIFQSRNIMEDKNLIISLFKEKLLIIDPKSKKLEYEQIKDEFINTLFEFNKIEQVLDYLVTNKIPLDKYIDQFSKFHEAFKNKPSLDLVLTLSKVYYLEFNQPESKIRIKNWKKEVAPEFYKIFKSNKFSIIREKDFKPLINLILTNISNIEDFINDISDLITNLFKNPLDKKIISFLLYINELLQAMANKTYAENIHYWIRTALELRKIGDKSSKLFIDLILDSFKNARDYFTPHTLLNIYFEENFTAFQSDVNKLNRCSEFLDNLKHIIYEIPNYQDKDALFAQIDIYIETLAQYYRGVILSRMGNQRIETIERSGPLAPARIAANLMDHISTKNPVPITRAITMLFNDWAHFPDLHRPIDRTMDILDLLREYQSGRRPQFYSVKPIFWFIVFEPILRKIWGEYYGRLPQNEIIHHENIIEIIKAQVNFFFEFQKVPSLNISYYDNRDKVVEYLKKMNEACRFTDQELRDIVNSSKFQSDSKYMLKKLIEEKNYCLFCSYNMPPGAKKCPNCGKEVKKISTEEPAIDFGAMGNFFSTQS